MPSKARSGSRSKPFTCAHGKAAHGRRKHRACKATPDGIGDTADQPATVRVRLSVNFRVTKRQMLCVGGDKLPFGWSFMSIAQVPMTWNPGDVWSVEVHMQPGERIQYKYVILEEQEWTRLVPNSSAEGIVESRHRNGKIAEPPPDNQTIQRKMAIVMWQPGPNRILQLPTNAELQAVRPGQTEQREPAQPRMDYSEVQGSAQQLASINASTLESLRLVQRDSVDPQQGDAPDADGSSAAAGPGRREYLLDRSDVWTAEGWEEGPPASRRA